MTETAPPDTGPHPGLTVFDAATGRILRNEPASLAPIFAALAGHLAAAGEDLVEGWHEGATHWINPATRQAEPLGDLAPAVTPGAISGLPAGARVLVAGRWVTPDAQGRVALAGSLALDQDVEAVIDCPGFAPARVTVPMRGAGEDGAHAVAQDVTRLRQGGYPEPGDQLDALWKAVAALAAGEPIPADAAQVLRAVQEVKAKYPKGARK